jgi:hypothetical protein
MIRWHATIVYRTDSGLNPVEHDLSELQEIQGLVERGPHWDTIDAIAILRVNHVTGEALTVEQAAKL